MSDARDPAVFRLALNRALGDAGITVGIRPITPTNVWVVAWRVNGKSVMRILHVALDGETPDLVEQVAALIRREFRKYP
ncbi:MAG TPA: hypothetical protein VFI12_07660 [Thermomicrobiales bacterium]|jgi:hypothetical protein|nr:hypothetical protein [Thermomicrobiales bacterium]